MRDTQVVLVTTAPVLNKATLELATGLAKRANAVLKFFHVVPLGPFPDAEAAVATVFQLPGSAIERWHSALRPTDGSVRFRHRIQVGFAEDRVREFVESHAVYLLVVEEPPRSMLAETLWRGLAERLIRGVDCPVVIGGPGFLRAEPRVRQPSYNPVGVAATADLLNAVVEARVEALRTWLGHMSTSVDRIAMSETVRTTVRLAGRNRGLMEARIEQRLQVEMNEHRQALKALGWRLTTDHRLWASHTFMVTPGRALTDFLRRVAESGCAASVPMSLTDEPDRLVILAGAQVATFEGEVGLLIFVFDAEHDFLRILGQPGPLPSFETYAFDRTGLMLSKTRFPADLVYTGLLVSDDDQTPLTVRVAEPSTGPTNHWPLTRMALQATARRDGCDTDGYLDYRGVRVMGAWRWLADYGFGVAAEVDVEVGGPT